ncbi:hypothetical protein LTR05_008741 [Lithohypha guttulata]|uniref:FAD/NAD(P)-binding domain-containing protein n=1 Tax=Lithohypha guttulata TaxID=1690604 RepID=A0AAN7SL96_9EURO|nr:hypothetical protein LTR05_008741 [Lithohypha guttulata]
MAVAPVGRHMHVVIAGGAYGGLSTALNLLRLSSPGNTISELLDGEARIPHGKPQYVPDYANDKRSPANKRTHRGQMRLDAHTLLSTIKKPKITIIEARDGYYHQVGTPLAHTSSSYTSRPWINYSDFHELSDPNVTVVRGTVEKVDLGSKIVKYSDGSAGNHKTIRDLDYDYLVIATGLRRMWPVVLLAMEKKQYEKDSQQFIKKIENCRNGVIVVGGGAIGIETAAEIKHQHPTIPVTLVHSRKRLLSSEPLSSEFQQTVLDLLRQQGVSVVLGHRVIKSVETITNKHQNGISNIHLDDGTALSADMVINANKGAKPATEFLPEDVLDENGFVKVASTGQLSGAQPGCSSVFALGDVVSSSEGIKLASTAIRAGRGVAMNIASCMMANQPGVVSYHARQMDIAIPNDTLKIVVGGTAAAYAQGKFTFGVDVRKKIFGDDVALSRGLRALGVIMAE